MCAKGSYRKPGSRILPIAAALVLAGTASAARAADDVPGAGLWDRMLEKFNVKAEPPPPAPDFVQRTHPDPDGLGYVKAAVPHKVSPLKVKTPAEIQAATAALDAARVRQLQPAGPPPLDLAKNQPAAPARHAAKAGKPAAPEPAATD